MSEHPAQRRTLAVLVAAQIFSGAGLAVGITVGALPAQDMQATAGELDHHLKRLLAHGFRRKAKQHKIILRGAPVPSALGRCGLSGVGSVVDGEQSAPEILIAVSPQRHRLVCVGRRTA